MTKNRVDTAPCRYARAWNSLIMVKSAVLDGIERELQAEHGLSLTEYSVLLRLDNAEGRRLRMADLATSILMSKSGATRLVDRLEDRDLVQRIPCAEDRRSIWARLTDKGLRRVEAIRPVHDMVVRDMLGRRLNEAEAERLAALLEKLLGPRA